jgi:threonine dehydrogenase-like Zn-dependent dehydrogenase
MWETVLRLLASGKLDPLRIVGRIENYANWRACFDEMASGEIVKAVLRPARENG